MAKPRKQTAVYLESGEKRVIAGAVDWPGWSRHGRDEAEALATLAAVGSRYAKIVARTGLAFEPPGDSSVLKVTERLAGNATTDFGVPGMAPTADALPMNASDLVAATTILQACWAAFDAAVAAATGKELAKGPRGGGRELDGIVRHVVESESGYVRSVGWKVELGDLSDLDGARTQSRKGVLEGLKLAAEGALPKVGPRGGVRWPPRYFVRRVAYHVVDHTWEIEDRVLAR